jgi:hypothetical protein
MATEDDVRRIGASLPETTQAVNPSGQMFIQVRDTDELTELITDAWRIQAPKKLIREYDGA